MKKKIKSHAIPILSPESSLGQLQITLCNMSKHCPCSSVVDNLKVLSDHTAACIYETVKAKLAEKLLPSFFANVTMTHLLCWLLKIQTFQKVCMVLFLFVITIGNDRRLKRHHLVCNQRMRCASPNSDV